MASYSALGSVFVFIVSSIIHSVLTYHFKDFKRAPDENKLMDAVRGLSIPPGEYLVPCAQSHADRKTPEFKEKLKKGPAIMLTVWDSAAISMGTSLIQWFVYLVIVGIFAAYVAGRAVGPGAPYLSVFRFAGVTAFACYAIAQWQETIWYKRSRGRALRNTIDGPVYALVAAGTFGWLWPA